MSLTSNKKSTDTFYKHTQWYSFTLAPSDEFQCIPQKCKSNPSGIIDPFTRLNKFKSIIRNHFLSYLSNGIKVRYSIDISEPKNINTSTRSGVASRLHIHGRILFTDNNAIFYWQLKYLQELSSFGIVDIDTCPDIDYWDEYCDKYNKITRLKPYENWTSKNNIKESSDDKGKKVYSFFPDS